jgi:hypothetical protein
MCMSLKELKEEDSKNRHCEGCNSELDHMGLCDNKNCIYYAYRKRDKERV